MSLQAPGERLNRVSRTILANLANTILLAIRWGIVACAVVIGMGIGLRSCGHGRPAGEIVADRR